MPLQPFLWPRVRRLAAAVAVGLLMVPVPSTLDAKAPGFPDCREPVCRDGRTHDVTPVADKAARVAERLVVSTLLPSNEFLEDAPDDANVAVAPLPLVEPAASADTSLQGVSWALLFDWAPMIMSSKALLLTLFAALSGLLLASAVSAGYGTRAPAPASSTPGAPLPDAVARSSRAGNGRHVAAVDQARASVGASRLTTAPGAAKLERATTVVHSEIGAGIVIEARLQCAGRVEISGRVIGPVIAGEIEILAGGEVDGDLAAELISIDGTLRGKADARSIHIGRDGHVEGSLGAAVLGIEEGAWVEADISCRGALA